MTDTHETASAVLLAAAAILSIVGGGVGAVGTAAANGTSDGVEVQDGQIEIAIEADGKLDELNVTVVTTDVHVDQYTHTLNLSNGDFDVTEDSGTYRYEAADAVESDRDGEWTISVDDYDSDSGSASLEGEFEDASGDEITVPVDTAAPSLEAATLEASYAGDTPEDAMGVDVFVEATFDQPADLSSSTPRLERDSDPLADLTISIEDDRADEGVVVFALSDEPQTGTGLDLNLSDVAAEFGSESTPETTLAQVHTITLDLEAGSNVVSIPAVTGTVDADAFDVEGVEAVWAYDAESNAWDSYVPDADDNDLTELRGGHGYVVVAESDVSVPVTAQNLATAGGGDAPQPMSQRTIHEGWNLIGHYQIADQPEAEALDTISESYDVIRQGYGTDPEGVLDAGEGYWIHANQDDVYAPQAFGTVGPDMFDVSVSEETEHTASIQVQIQTGGAPIQQVTVYRPSLSGETELVEDFEHHGQGVLFESKSDLDVSTDQNVYFKVTDTSGNFDTTQADVSDIDG